jgi:hypothetical protein
MLNIEREIKEVYHLKHKHDTREGDSYNYEEDLLKRTLSPVMFSNPTMRMFLDNIQKLLVVMIDNTAQVRNSLNYIVDKYYNKHIN